MSEQHSELIERIRNRETDALVTYIEAFRPQLLAVIHRQTSDTLKRKVEPEDLLQEVSVTAVGSLPEIDFTDRDPFQWLCGLCERRVIDAHRRYVAAQKRSAKKEVGLQTPGEEGGGLIDVLVASMTSPSAAFSRDQREFHLLAAMEELPEASRETLRLRYVEGLPSKEIADRIGKSDAATRVLLSRSLAKLQETLATNDIFKSFRQA